MLYVLTCKKTPRTARSREGAGHLISFRMVPLQLHLTGLDYFFSVSRTCSAEISFSVM